MPLLSYDDRSKLRENLRRAIEIDAIYRADRSHPRIPGKAPGTTYVWQFYLRRITLQPIFARAIGLLFWDRFLEEFQRQSFQVCACSPSGVPIGCGIAKVARELKLPLTMFFARREPKFGLDRWFDGPAPQMSPVLLVDDVAASAPFLAAAATRIQQKLEIPLHANYFTVINKVGRNVPMAAQHTDSYLDGELVSLFTLNNFALMSAQFAAVHGRDPAWSGLVR